MRPVGDLRKVNIEASKYSMQFSSKCECIVRSVNVNAVDEMSNITVKHVENFESGFPRFALEAG